jgi:two-component system LytT family response regulator
MFRALVVDSQYFSREVIARTLESDESIQLIKVCATAMEAREAIREEHPDLAFIDLELPDMSGFDLIRSIEEIPAVVLLSRTEEHASRAFETSAVDYLVKPFLRGRLLTAVNRAKAKVRAASLSAEEAERSFEGRESNGEAVFPERLTLRTGQAQVIQKVQLIDYCAAAANYVNVHCRSRSFRIRCTMSELEEQLDPRKFVRIHRSAVVNLESVREFRPHPKTGYIVTLVNGVELRISRGYWPKFRSALFRQTHFLGYTRRLTEERPGQGSSPSPAPE